MQVAVHLIVPLDLVDRALEIAWACEVPGASLIACRGGGRHGQQSLLACPIDERMEMLLILCDQSLAQVLLEKLREGLDLDAAGHGILFVFPVRDVQGVGRDEQGSRA